MRRTHPKLFMTFIIMGIFLAVIAVAAIVTGCVIMAHDAGTSGEFEYLIVLGTTVNGTEPSSMLEDRINAAYEYLSTHESVICIVSGGMANENRISEAQCMFNELTALGISPERIWMEDKATSTRENLAHSMVLIEEKTGIRPQAVGILSSEFHLLRAEMFAKEQSVQAVTIPAKTTDSATFWGYFLREILMVWYYGTMG